MIYKRIMPLSISGFHLLTSEIFRLMEEATNTHDQRKISPECIISMSKLPHSLFYMPESFKFILFFFAELHFPLFPRELECTEFPKLVSPIFHVSVSPHSFFLPPFFTSRLILWQAAFSGLLRIFLHCISE